MNIDEELLRVIGDTAHTTVRFRSAPDPISGGYWAQIFGFELADAPTPWVGPLVARLMPSPQAAAKEIVVQATLAAGGFPTPDVLASGVDDGLGGAYMIMRRAVGRPPLTDLTMPRALPSLPRIMRELPDLLARVALQLHAVDPVPLRAALDDGGVILPAISELGHLRNIEAAAATQATTAATGSATGFADLLAWLDLHRPAENAPVICHGDLHPMNLLVTDDGAVTVLDWTNANISPREFDVGFTAALLRCAPIAVPRLVRPLLRRLTGGLADRFVARYDAGAAINRLTLRWFEAFQYTRCLAEVALGRTDTSSNIGPRHPFEIAAQAMIHELASITGITVALPPRTPQQRTA